MKNLCRLAYEFELNESQRNAIGGQTKRESNASPGTAFLLMATNKVVVDPDCQAQPNSEDESSRKLRNYTMEYESL